MILHNILIIGLIWVISTVVLGSIYAIICFIIGVINGAKSMETEDFVSRFEEEYFKDCRDKLKWYLKMPIAIQWLLLPIVLIVYIGVGLYYIFN